MRTRSVLALSVAAVGSVWFLGCRQALQITVPLELDPALGTFDVEAGVATQNKATSSLPESAVNIGSGSIAIDLGDITFTPADGGGGKGGVNLQAGDTIEVTVRIASLDDEETVCEDGEEYGPFIIELDENLDPESISPSRITFSANTIEIFNEREFALCIDVLSSQTGTLEIGQFTLRLGL